MPMGLVPAGRSVGVIPGVPRDDRDRSDHQRCACVHCGLDVPAGLIEPDTSEQFCCAGCRLAHAVICSSGLESYYDVLSRVGGERRAASPSERRYEEFDDPAFLAANGEGVVGGLCRVTLLVEGMHCAACVWLLERLPSCVSGVVESRASFGRRTLTVTIDPSRAKVGDIARFVDRLGYPVHVLREGALSALRVREDRAALIRIGVAGAIAGNVMLIAFALYGGMFDGMSQGFATMFRWVSAGLAIISLAWPGRSFFRGMWTSIRQRTPSMDLPVALGLSVGGTVGLINTIRGTGEIYFDSITAIVFLLLIGRFLLARQQRRAHESAERLFSLTPSAASLVDETTGDVRTVAVERLERGDLIEIGPGASAPVDGEIISGETDVDTGILTGESRPVPVGVGDAIEAGTVNLASPIRVRVGAAGDETRVGQLMRFIEECSASRAPIVQMADRLAGWFVCVVILLALLTFGRFTLLGELHDAVQYATAMLIVTCPCALALATPLAVVAALGRAASSGLAIKGGAPLELLATPGDSGVVVLDKTGTITEGCANVVWALGDAQALRLASIAERSCQHPFAQAIAQWHPRGRTFNGTPAERSPTPEVTSISQTLGAGVEFDAGGSNYAVGSIRFVRERMRDGESALAEGEGWRWIDLALAEGLTPIVVARDQRVVGVFGVGDRIRDDAQESIAWLRDAGWRVIIASGDHESVVLSVADQVGIPREDVHGAMTPENKLELVHKLMSRGDRVVMVGDGVNDAAALAASSVGVAVHGSAEASLQAADVFVTRPGLTALRDLHEGSRRTIRAIRLCLRASLAYNLVCATLTFMGLINPLLAAVLMPLSSLTVLTLAWSAKTFPARGRRAGRAPLAGAPVLGGSV